MVPSELSVLISLTFLDVSKNQMSGSMPFLIGTVQADCCGNIPIARCTCPDGGSPIQCYYCDCVCGASGNSFNEREQYNEGT